MATHFPFLLLFALPAVIRCASGTAGPLIRVSTETEDDIRALRYVISAHRAELDVWRPAKHSGDWTDMLISPEVRQAVEDRLLASGLSYRVLLEDVQDLVAAHLAENQAASRKAENQAAGAGYDYASYLPYHEIVQWIDRQVAGCNICHKFSVGQTYEGRNMTAIKISTGSGHVGFWLDGGIHAREWISPATVMYMTEQLISRRNTDDDVRRLLDTYDWYILPVQNVDGYVYTWRDTRLWRKSRQPINGNCTGIDVNRNFAFHWDTVGTSDDPCDNTYPGSAPFSAPEASHVANFINSRPSGFFHAFLTVHSYGQLLTPPYGYTRDPPSDYPELERAALVFTNALTAVHGTPYRVGQSSVILYDNSGTSMDWAKGAAGIRYVYTAELRPDNSTIGFVLPPDQILGTGEETWAGLKAMALDIADRIDKPITTTEPCSMAPAAVASLWLLSLLALTAGYIK